jgi:hypothetical protein
MNAVNSAECFACGATLPDIAGPVHAYMLSSPGCWNQYCSLLVWKNSLGGARGVTIAQELVDAYAIQHATNPDRRNCQSVAVHLMSLCAGLERGISGVRRRTLIGGWSRREYAELLPRPDVFLVTVRDVADANAALRAEVVDEWAASAWHAWVQQHDQVRKWLDEATFK